MSPGGRWSVDRPKVLVVACSDYRRKIPWASMAMLLERQAADARELRQDAHDWAGDSTVEVYRCQIDVDGIASFASLE